MRNKYRGRLWSSRRSVRNFRTMCLNNEFRKHKKYHVLAWRLKLGKRYITSSGKRIVD